MKGEGYPINDTVREVGKTGWSGNVMPRTWPLYIKRESGRVDANAIILLADILYWYRPMEVVDEATGAVVAIRKKFKADKLQRSYDAFAERYGMTKRQVKDALKNLERLKLITLEHRTVTTSGGLKLGNVTFIGINVDQLKYITHNYPSNAKTSEGSHLNVTPMTLECQTNTEITTEITQNGETDADYKKRLQDILIEGNGKEHSERLVKERKEKIMAAVVASQTKSEDDRDAIVRCFGTTPNWKTKTNINFLHWLAERDARETVDGFASWWYANDWRGKKGQPPSINQIQENWKRAFDETDAQSRALDEQFPLMSSVQ